MLSKSILYFLCKFQSEPVDGSGDYNSYDGEEDPADYSGYDDDDDDFDPPIKFGAEPDLVSTLY